MITLAGDSNIDGSRFRAWGAAADAATFVIAAIIVTVPFADRPLALPVLFRLWRPGGPTKTVLARELIGLVAATRRDRRIHVVADNAYLCTTLRQVPTNVTLTGPLARNAAL